MSINLDVVVFLQLELFILSLIFFLAQLHYQVMDSIHTVIRCKEACSEKC